ncbi:MAG: repeat-containing protein [Clostridiales bacterium]|jgi:alpha-tubulin suppressor-like RCC1 family protein|nr:repeat-containing protein [Clostridiales bacterium]
MAPSQVGNLNNVKSLAVGEYHALALKEDATVWAWGRNNYGQIGNGSTINSLIPLQIPGLNNIIAIATTKGTKEGSFAVKQDGTVWAWGFSGILGNNSSQNSLVPQQINT